MKQKQTLLTSTSSILTATALVAFAQTSAASALFTSGHGDLAVGFEDGDFEFGFHLGEGNDEAIVDGMVIDDVEFEANELIVQVTEQVLVESDAPADLLNGTGTAAGDIVYLIAQDSSGVTSPVFGLDTEELEQPTGITWSDVTYTLENVDGPGLFSVYRTEDNSFTFNFSEALNEDSFTFSAGGHEEQNWAFTEAGTYEITLTAAATRTEAGVGAQDFSSTEVFTFQVVPEPSSALLLAASSFGLLLRRRRS